MTTRDQLIVNLLTLLDAEDWQRIKSLFPNNGKCPTCSDAQSYRLNGLDVECDCKLQITLSQAYYGANIGRDYHTLSFDDFIGEDRELLINTVNDYVSNITANLYSGIGLTFDGPLGSGKAQPLDSGVLTPDGWTTMGELKVGDKIIGEDGQAHNVIAIFPQGVRDSYKITFSDGATVESCDEHLWQTSQDSTGRDARILPLLQIMKTLHKSGKKKDRNHWIPIIAPVQFNENILPMDPYLLGVLLGDGCLTGRNRSLMLSNTDVELLDYVREIIAKDDLRLNHGSREADWRIISDGAHDNPLIRSLKELGLWTKASPEKWIPAQFLFTSVENRAQLLAGLIDSDGSIENDCLDFASSSKKLTEGVVELIRSLGGITSDISIAPTHYKKNGIITDCKLRYRIFSNLGKISVDIPTRISHKKIVKDREYKNKKGSQGNPRRAIDSIELVGKKEMRCIVVDNLSRLYITDGYVVTHNSLASSLILKELVKEGYRCYFISFNDLIHAWGARWNNDEAKWLDHKLRSVQVLVIDELATDGRNHSGFLSSGFESIIRHRASNNKPTIITTNLDRDREEKIFTKAFSLLSAYNARISTYGEDIRGTIIRERRFQLQESNERRPVL